MSKLYVLRFNDVSFSMRFLCRSKVEEKGYAVVVVAEGAGEELLGESTVKDASGWVEFEQAYREARRVGFAPPTAIRVV